LRKKKLKIGLVSGHDENIWSNGLVQNVWNLYRLLKLAGYNVHCVSQSSKIAGKSLFDAKIKPLLIENANQYDLIIEIVHGLTTKLADSYVKKGGIVVGVQYGNNLLIHTENMLFKDDLLPKHETRRSEIWTSPHYDFAVPAYEILEKMPVKTCPYVWDSDIFDLACKNKKYDPFFKQGQDIKTFASFEPNINMVKTSTIPILIAEKYADMTGDYDKDVYIFGAEKLKGNPTFIDFIRKLELHKKRKISFEGRWHTPFVMHKGFADVIISHQWQNHLNYLQLEAMYTNRPCVHNNPRLAEYGSFYNEFDVTEGALQLQNALETHNENFEEISEMNRERLWRFSPINKKNVQGYSELIEELMDKR